MGLGSWGLSVLERVVARSRRTGAAVTVHVIQPSPVGGGAYESSQPDYLILNNACGQLSLWASPGGSPEPAYAVGFYQWALDRGYSWHGDECRTAAGGRPIEPGDYLPRRLMGEYLGWFYRTLVSAAPSNVEIVHHDTRAADIVAEAGGRERVVLDDATAISVDHVVITSGHTWNEEPPAPGAPRTHRPYPVSFFDQVAPAGAPIAIAGLGLVAFDLLAALSVGRGGRFHADGDRLRYHRSGSEPAVVLYSRSGVPYCAKAISGVDPTGGYRPVVCTPEVFAGLRAGRGGSRRGVDFRGELLPLIFAEMQARYHVHSAALRDGAAAVAPLRTRLAAAWEGGRFEEEIARLESVHGAFDPRGHLFAGAGERWRSGAEYEAALYRRVEEDLDAALDPRGSPVKAAQEVTRILRDDLRSVIEFGGLTLDSYVDFQSSVRGRINRLEAGPPALRSQQLLALMDEGIVRVPLGPAPELSATPDGRVVLRSTQLERVHATTVRAVVRGHLDMPSLARSASPLLRRLTTTGRLTQLTYGDTPVGSVAISEDFHPYDSEGRMQATLSLLGVLTEGARYFTHYLPSPQSRMRAVLDAEACVAGVIG